MPALASSAQLVAFPGPGVSLRAALLPALKRHRLPEQLIESLMREASVLPSCGIDEALALVLKTRMRPAPLNFARTPHLFLIGPSGAGVTSAAAKLRHHAKALGTSVTIEESSFNPLNCRARTAFASLHERQDRDTIGVVSALADAEEVSEVIAQFRLERVIVTGLDMARRLGALAAALTQGARQAGMARSTKADAPLEILSARALARLLLN
jgi:flagellar biosynthesis GTPase FlhF